MLKPSYSSSDSHIVVVGGNSGIGKATISQLLQANASVYSIDISSTPTDISGENFHYYTCDPLKLDELRQIAGRIAEKAPSLTGLICLSGTIKHFKPILSQAPEEWQEVFDISFKSCYNACKVFTPLLQKSQQAAIVNMSSGLAFGGMANYGPYTNAKAAINSLSKTLATELAPDIRVNTVAPGAVDTPFIKDTSGNTRINIEAYKKIVPLGSMAKPDEIADLILFLMSEGASHITGQCVHINGGAMMI